MVNGISIKLSIEQQCRKCEGTLAEVSAESASRSCGGGGGGLGPFLLGGGGEFSRGSCLNAIYSPGTSTLCAVYVTGRLSCHVGKFSTFNYTKPSTHKTLISVSVSVHIV